MTQTSTTLEPLDKRSFIERYFSPENRLAEIICGLVMVLSFTATTSATFEGTTPHALLLAVVGCNLAWAIVDAVTYVLGNLINRGARTRLIKMLQKSPDHPQASAVVRRRLEDTFGELLTDSQREQVHGWVLASAARLTPQPTRLTREDWYVAVACFMLVFGATLPVVVPFLLIRNEVVALRVSNALALAMLFGVGWRWAAHVHANRWKIGFSLLALGIVLVAITIVLGG